MATYAPVAYTTAASNTQIDFDITFTFLRATDVVVSVIDPSGNVLVNGADYDAELLTVNDGTFDMRVVQAGTLNTTRDPLAANHVVSIKRNTDISQIVTVFQDGASFKAADINAIITQLFNKIQEVEVTGSEGIGLTDDLVAFDAENKPLRNLGTPTANNDAVRKVDVDSGIGPAITTVAGIASDVTAVVADQADIGVVSTNLSGTDTIGTVAGSIANVNTVGGSIANVNAVAADQVDIGVVATDLSGSDTIGTVAASIANVNTIAGNDAGGTAHLTNISDLAPQATNIGTLATGTDSGGTAYLTHLENASTNAAAAQAALEAFNRTYLGAYSADPIVDGNGDPLTDGDLYYNTTSNNLKFYDASSTVWVVLNNSVQVNAAATLGATGDVTFTSETHQDFIMRDNSNPAKWINVSPSVARTNLGLGTAAVQDVDAFATGAEGDLASSALQPGDVVNDVTTGGTQVPLSAEQGVALQSGIDGKIANLADDTTPQLGGNLDVNGNSIVSASGGNIPITPDGAGKVILDGLSWPTADGTADQLLKTDGAGNLAFADASGGAPAIIHDSEDTTLNPYLHVIAGGGSFTAVTTTLTIPAGVTRAYIWAIGAGGAGGDARGTDGSSIVIGGPGGNGSVGLTKIVDLDLLTAITGLYCEVNVTGNAFVRLNDATGTEIAQGNPGGDGTDLANSSRVIGRSGAPGATPFGGNVTHGGSGAATFTEVTTVVGQPALGTWSGAGRFIPRPTGGRDPAITTVAQTLLANLTEVMHFMSPLYGLLPDDTVLMFTNVAGALRNISQPARTIGEVGLGGIPALSVNQTVQLFGGDGGPGGIVVFFQ